MTEYTPVLNGEELETECGDLATSLRNIDRINHTGNTRIEDLYAHIGQVVVQFNTGERLWATGLNTTSDEAVSTLLDLLLAGHPNLDTESGAAIHRVIMGLPAGFSGSLNRYLRSELAKDNGG